MRKKKTVGEVWGHGRIVLYAPNGWNNCPSFVGLVVGNHILNDKKNGITKGYLVVAKPEEYYIFMILSSFTCGCTRFEEKYLLGEKSLSVPVDLSEELELYRSQIKTKGKQSAKYFRDFVFGFSENQKRMLEAAAMVQHFKDGGSENDIPAWMSSFKETAKVLFPLLREAIILP